MQDRPSSSRSVLVVDDVPEICELFHEAIRRIRGLHVEVVTEVNSARAVGLLGTRTFDVVVSDYHMREVDGITVLSCARNVHPRGYRLLMTGYDEIPTSLERIRGAGVDAYLRKPLRTQELGIALAGFLNGHRPVIDQARAEAREVERLAETDAGRAVG